ncbi:hypothetical protein EJ110_NYTH39205 [Nymphaea thermarum]|nr:hypothetical protein EJ110_NYTH39205 [Nymphaea thermarum]
MVKAVAELTILLPNVTLRSRLMATGHAEQDTSVLSNQFFHQTLSTEQAEQNERLNKSINKFFVLFCSELTLGTDRTEHYSSPGPDDYQPRPRALALDAISFSSTSALISAYFLLPLSTALRLPPLLCCYFFLHFINRRVLLTPFHRRRVVQSPLTRVFALAPQPPIFLAPHACSPSLNLSPPSSVQLIEAAPRPTNQAICMFHSCTCK